MRISRNILNTEIDQSVIHTDEIIDTRAQKMVSHTAAHYIIFFFK